MNVITYHLDAGYWLVLKDPQSTGEAHIQGGTDRQPLSGLDGAKWGSETELGVWFSWIPVLCSQFILNAHQNCSKNGIKLTFVLMTIWRHCSTTAQPLVVVSVGTKLWTPTEAIAVETAKQFRSNVLMQQWYKVLAPYQSPDMTDNEKSQQATTV